jgi:hypothetical protein
MTTATLVPLSDADRVKIVKALALLAAMDSHLDWADDVRDTRELASHVLGDLDPEA